MLLACVPLGVFAGDSARPDAMQEIEASFASYKTGDTVTVENDGYIGIPVKVTAYYDTSKGDIIPGADGTPIIIYVVNTMVERIGTDSDTAIIQSMLDRGYIVAVFDYMNNAKAVSPDLDYSVTYIRNLIEQKYLLHNSVIPMSTGMTHVYVVPSGYNITVEDVYFELDKHGAAGTLEKIVENWNNDLRGCKSGVVIPWVYEDGTRKSTIVATDGTSPEWYSDAAGKNLDMENGTYTKIKWTYANDITDCVRPDGTPIDLSLYMTVTYPTNPQKEVPVMAYSSCQGTLSLATRLPEDSHVNGFLFNGYAGVIYDHAWVPMARSINYDYYDGNDWGGISNDGLSYSLQYYNNKEVDTAAMRYIRYLALDNPETYVLDTDHIGVYGYSKGGWMSALGEAVFQTPLIKNPEDYSSVAELEAAITTAISSMNDKRIYAGYNGETRFEAGETETIVKNGATIDGGEVQPWLTYNGVEIISGAQLIYPCVGSSPEDVSEGHSPMFVTNNAADGIQGAYSTMNTFAVVCKNHDVPTMFFEANIPHAMAYGPDSDYGVDTYQAFFDFAGYYLKGDAVKVMLVYPKSDTSGVSVGDDIIIRFSGAVTAEEITKVTVKDSGGNSVNGTWVSEYGKVQWIFKPHNAKGNETYTVYIPADIKGDNGKEMGIAYSQSFNTKPDTATAASSVVRVDGGSFTTFTVPTLSANTNGYYFRFRVANDAANVAELYAVDSFNTANPEASVLGDLIGKINLKGIGIYDIDITDYIAPKAGESITLFVKEQKTPGASVVTSVDFNNGDISFARPGGHMYVTSAADPKNAGNTVFKAIPKTTGQQFTNDESYYGPQQLLYYADAIKSTNLSADDYGRKFTVSFKVYDTESRLLQVELSKCTDFDYKVVDYQYPIYNFKTVAGEWTTITVEYTVYDMEYGLKGVSMKKGLSILAMAEGAKETPVYIDDIIVTETVTEIDMADFAIATKDNGGADYKAPASDKPFTLYNGTTAGESYDNLRDALTAYVAGGATAIQLNSNYIFTDSDIFDGYKAIENIVIDLNGYTINCQNTEKSLFYAKSDGNANIATQISVINGGINLGSTPLISYENSTSGGSGKCFDLSFDGVTFGVTEGTTLRSYLSADSAPKGVSLDIDISLVDCIFDIPDGKIPNTLMILLPPSNGGLDISYELTGPVFELSTQRWVRIQTDTKCSVYHAGDDGKYATLILNTEDTPWDTAYVMTDTAGIFDGREEKNGYAYFYLTESELATKYGMILREYDSIEDYPLVVFDEYGSLMAATNYFAQDNETSALSTVATRSYGKWYIHLRRDFEFNEPRFNNFGFVVGDIVIDLNGHTITTNAAAELFKSHAKLGGDFNITVKNGTIAVANSNSIVTFSAGASALYDGVIPKKMEFVFENVTFDVSDKPSQLFGYGGSNINLIGNLTFNGCTFDLTDAKDGFKIFSLSDSANLLTSAVRINGGTFISDTFDKIGIYSAMNKRSSILFADGENGNYPVVITTAAGGYPPSDNIVTAAGNMVYSNGVTEGGLTTYTLKVNTSLTPYGTIPEQYSDPDDYPFILFKEGVFEGAYTAWMDSKINGSSSTPYGVVTAAKEIVYKGDGTCTILLRRDYVIQSGAYNNLSHVNGTVNVDLGGHTLTTGESSLLVANKKSTHNTAFNFFGGEILLNNNTPLVSFGQGDGGVGYKFNISFEGVNIGFANALSTETKVNIIEVFNNALSDNKVINSTLKFTNCYFDFTYNVGSRNISFINLSGDPDCHKIDVTFEGSTIDSTAKSFNFITLSQNNAANDTVVFKPYNGLYLTIKVASAAQLPNFTLDGENKDLKLYQYASDSQGITYALSAYDLSTPYGAIAPEYGDAEKYPFVIFTKDGNKYVFHGAYETWADTDNGGSGNPAGALLAAKNSAWLDPVIFVRRDYDIQTGAYNNLGHIRNGTVYVDLNGKTLSAGNAVFFAAASKWTTDTLIVVKNGTILLENERLISLQASDAAGTSKFVFTFENVNLGLANGATVTTIIDTFPAECVASTVCGAEINFINCNIDLRTNAPANGITFFRGAGDNGHHKAAVTIDGGSIKVGNSADFTLFDFNNQAGTTAQDSLTLLKNANGSYPEIIVNSGTTPTFTTLNDGALTLVLKSDNGTDAVYAPIITEAVGVDFTPKASITLDSNLIFNIYIPAHTGLGAVTLNGTAVTLGEAKEGYYLVTEELPANEAARELVLAVELTANGTPLKATFTFSTVKYAEKLLTMDITNREKPLAKDILSYVKSAYEYFTVADRAAVIDEIDAILGNYVSDKVINVADAKCDTEGLSGATLVLGAAPAIRFYLDGYTADKFSFKVGKRALNVTDANLGSDANGSYIEFTLFAYEMTETFTYEIEGTEITGEYNIVSYYADAVAKSDTALADIVAKFYNYCKSAYEYKLAVTNQ